MIWHNPLPLKLVATGDSNSFAQMPVGVTGIPVFNHVGAFGVTRKHHVHEGVDLYAPQDCQVFAVEDGEVVAVIPFTGPKAQLPWWLDTDIVLVEGTSGVVAYGEIVPSVIVGQHLRAGEQLGTVTRVLRHDKGRPTTMLHLELHQHGTRVCPPWETVRPSTLLDPTPYLLAIAEHR